MINFKNVFNPVRDIFFAFILLILPFEIYAQSFESEIKDALHTKPKIDFRFDSRSTFVSQRGVRVFGIKLGLEYDNKLTFGVGYNELISKVKRKRKYNNLEQTVRLSYYYFSPFVDYVFYKDKRWLLSIPVQFGLGETAFQTTETEDQHIFDCGFMLSYEPAISFEYRFLRYFGAGAGVGYRLMIVKNPKLDEQFTSPVYLFRFKVYFRDIYKDIFRN